MSIQKTATTTEYAKWCQSRKEVAAAQLAILVDTVQVSAY